ncbi:nuclear transport factor 2 family protein [Uliginosibacterium gangwonense]|uniref:nuclear transport factor 2 family protein n=1 Tax=Uliginosibacterium gangwonense TaxID=392736 RepID=UPI000364C277|nr:nuclear transport factor 2 family protein [Uliginosibacterium gangwonense]
MHSPKIHLSRKFARLLMALALAISMPLLAPAHAQEAVVGVQDAEALFTSPDPKLAANKQVVYHIVRDLLEAGHWDLADKYLSERYIQHNPNAASGRAGVVHYFVDVLKVKPSPIPAKITTPIVAVLAEGDLVVVVYPQVVKNEADPSKSYSTTWFDMWRIKDGKADEHWDPALKE